MIILFISLYSYIPIDERKAAQQVMMASWIYISTAGTGPRWRTSPTFFKIRVQESKKLLITKNGSDKRYQIQKL